MYLSPIKMKWMLNWYPPYFLTGISVDYIAKDWSEMQVKMVLRWYNSNAVGSHFGGSLYSMVDPHFMLMLMQLLGSEYIIWDRAASIDYIKAARETVFARFIISNTEVEKIRQETAGGKRYLPSFSVEIKTASGETVARVSKVIYVKRKSK